MKLTAANTAIVLDSTADLPDARERFPNWRVVPLYVRFGDETFRDYVDLGPDEFYARLRDSRVQPATSQPTPGDFVRVYEELVQSYDRVLSLQISSTLSGTFASAETAAASAGAAVRVIDTRTATVAIALLALAIERRLERGTSDEEVDALVARFASEHRLIATVDTLDYLARGGRIGRAAAFAGTLLDVKPIIEVAGGEVLPLKRVRGSRKAVAELARLFAEAVADGPGLRVGIAQAAAPQRAQQLEEAVRSVRPQAQLELTTALGPVVGTHAGPGAVGLCWFADP